MRILVQRVKGANVAVSGQDTAADIRQGLLLFAGVGKDDGTEDIEHLS